MGAEYIDYLIGDPVVIPAAHRADYTEKIVRLPDSYQPNDNKRRILGSRVFRRAELGLPETGFVFCCFNNNYKITPDVFDLWMKDPWFGAGERAVAARGQCDGGGEPAARSGAAGRIRRPAGVCAADGPGRASVAAPAGRPVPRHAAVQCAHDGERRALGRPAGADTAGGDVCRPGGGQPADVDWPAGADHRDARGLCRSGNRAGARAGTTGGAASTSGCSRIATALFDIAGFARHIEAAYTAMYERYQAGLPPDHIDIPR